ncbi:hypothetical protein QLS71_017475 [Mariniflexile litorale]|uniref:Uncharacterized protein n=1 Tax=Mariniflexile litorale TaxID=3045158 RepID=A0AAU7EG12_9FLAO|nr:hypothetical protein [Mariniflexile sp. KMM 9835]MDQ8211638.1 hypothetical protein [Mariniflexile sp. KMM 9835]
MLYSKEKLESRKTIYDLVNLFNRNLSHKRANGFNRTTLSGKPRK